MKFTHCLYTSVTERQIRFICVKIVSHICLSNIYLARYLHARESSVFWRNLCLEDLSFTQYLSINLSFRGHFAFSRMYTVCLFVGVCIFCSSAETCSKSISSTWMLSRRIELNVIWKFDSSSILFNKFVAISSFLLTGDTGFHKYTSCWHASDNATYVESTVDDATTDFHWDFQSNGLPARNNVPCGRDSFALIYIMVSGDESG